ncbi:MAG: hypothetical protein A2945_04065 [Candidatus Liptonbacteria bacterium RIFCSPLOWO2_01_FULL_52_25]|uniref:Uncharacterized protein n=1 Tax=Candidatus Liptonbacteria bacterium RIFCSPLOWO2_01_FULL_52_25 TaxID=1798650 RepID=A0A1G2CCT1_9BACT|nr:MAG: hypothetical protein A2945_04065 [Candidatus Liptonbacteria bacterium RIFCSPLOWO2_01_FULL_52_25]
MLKFSGKTIAFFVVTAIVVVSVIVAILGQRKGSEDAAQRPVYPPTQITPTYAAKGEVVAGFPKELILDERASVAASYALHYEEKLNQYSTEFHSDRSMEELYDVYLAYFEGDGWTLVNAITKYPGSRGLYAKKSAADASVTILATDHSARVMVSYVVR